MTLPTLPAENCNGMRKKELARRKPPLEEVAAVKQFRTNVRACLAVATNGHKVTQEEIAKRAGLSLRALGYQLSGEAKNAPTLRTLQGLANAFGLEPWQLLLPDLPTALILNPATRAKVRTTIQRYLSADDSDRDLVDKVASKLHTVAK